jgi:hypothetical protein
MRKKEMRKRSRIRVAINIRMLRTGISKLKK